MQMHTVSQTIFTQSPKILQQGRETMIQDKLKQFFKSNQYLLFQLHWWESMLTNSLTVWSFADSNLKADIS